MRHIRNLEQFTLHFMTQETKVLKEIHTNVSAITRVCSYSIT